MAFGEDSTSDDTRGFPIDGVEMNIFDDDGKGTIQGHISENVVRRKSIKEIFTNAAYVLGRMKVERI